MIYLFKNSGESTRISNFPDSLIINFLQFLRKCVRSLGSNSLDFLEVASTNVFFDAPAQEASILNDIADFFFQTSETLMDLRRAIVLYLSQVERPSNSSFTDALIASRGFSSWFSTFTAAAAATISAAAAEDPLPPAVQVLTISWQGVFPREFPVRFRTKSPRHLHSLRIVCRAVYLLVISYAVLLGCRFPPIAISRSSPSLMISVFPSIPISYLVRIANSN